MDKINLLDLLKYIPPSELDYQEWVNVGMALKHEGYSASDWDSWSRSDTRYHPGECDKKWESFNGSSAPVTAGTIVQLAKEHGFSFSREYKSFDWDDEISAEVGQPEESAEGVKVHEPNKWDPVKEIITYLDLIFERDEYVGYVTETYEDEKDGQKIYPPTKGAYDRTAGKLISELEKCGGDIGAVLGDANEKAGAWIRINPLDGKGVKDANVSDYRYVLIESDSLSIERQNALMRELELPIVTLTHTGGKSLHAIVRVDAKDREEYRKRVAYLFDVCKKNGLEIDKSCKNPSRLSRLPGFMRNGKKQYLVDTNIGKGSFDEWKDYIEEISDDLPDEVNFADIFENMPDLKPPLIDGILRQGHKMLLAGPSKAGKSFGLIELAVAIAEGTSWLGFKCVQGKVWYINLELDEASCWHRIADVYNAMGIQPKNASNLDVWNLRGKSIPMDKLAAPLIRRAKKKGYAAIIIDPIYKVITGDENSAEQMAHFCNQFDKVCRDASSAVICCHHHSKGAQGGKRSMDRASGSGVFARDPDALLDLSELQITDTLLKAEEDKAVCSCCAEWLKRFGFDFEDLSQDDVLSPKTMLDTAQDHLQSRSYKLLLADIEAAKKRIRSRTAWRIEGTLREFPKFEPINLWFDYPIHRADTTGVLKDLSTDDNTWQQNFSKKKSNKQRAEERKDSLETAFSADVNDEGQALVSDIAEYLGVSEKTVRRRIKEHGGFWVDESHVGEK